jgi:hypothetical protein
VAGLESPQTNNSFFQINLPTSQQKHSVFWPKMVVYANGSRPPALYAYDPRRLVQGFYSFLAIAWLLFMTFFSAKGPTLEDRAENSLLRTLQNNLENSMARPQSNGGYPSQSQYPSDRRGFGGNVQDGRFGRQPMNCNIPAGG